jgi:putative endonuclease
MKMDLPLFSAKQTKTKNPAKQTKSEFGKEGEDVSCNFLRSKGYNILGRNIRETFGEIDILARHPKGILVFVEVKSVNLNREGYGPEDQMSLAKIQKLRKTCEFLANKHPELLDRKKGWQIDSLCLTKSDKYFEIKHYENIA